MCFGRVKDRKLLNVPGAVQYAEPEKKGAVESAATMVVSGVVPDREPSPPSTPLKLPLAASRRSQRWEGVGVAVGTGVPVVLGVWEGVLLGDAPSGRDAVGVEVEEGVCVRLDVLRGGVEEEGS